MSDNMVLWNRLRTVPAEHLKTILAGRLKGKSDINPQWRLQIMTEIFGPIGFNWKYEIKRLWTEPGDNGEVCAFAQVDVSVKVGDSWSAPVPGIGGSMLVAQESSGKHTNDECYKMAVTDALSVALKALGVAADIYLGKHDGSKYLTDTGNGRTYEPVPQQKRHDSPPPPVRDEGDHWCAEHNCQFYRNEKNGEVWYSHKIKNGPNAGRYCNEGKGVK